MHIGMTKQNLLYTAAAAATASKSPMSLPGMTFVPPTKPLDEAPKKAAPVQHENQSQHLFDNVPESFETLPVAAAAAMLDSQDDYTRSGQSAPKAVIMTQETQASRRWEPASDDYAKPKDDTVHSTWNTVTDSRQDDSDYHQHHQHQVLETTKIDFDERIPEIHCSLCVPPPHQPTPEPMAHYYSPTNRPINVRRKTPVSQVFDAPINSLWKNKFGTFNQLQSEIANTLAYSDDNVVVSAPTGAGKTAVFEMAMARFFQVDLQHNNGGGVNNNNRGPRRMQISKQRKIVYVSPSKALCEERFEDWSTRTTAMQLGIEVALITGDGDPGEAFRDLASAHLILTTPEKWDSLTRKWTENFFLFGCVKLFLIDEVHLLADSGRGCCLESVVCRMKGIQRVSRKVQVTPADIETCRYEAALCGSSNCRLVVPLF
jgi:superfamily II RNA helicase